MKYFFLILVLLFNLNCFSENKKQKHFHLSIQQGNKEKRIRGNSITLQKEEFDIIFHLAESSEILINASYNKNNYKLAAKRRVPEKLVGFESIGIETIHVTDSTDLYLSGLTPYYWHYINSTYSRFCKIYDVDESELKAIRTVEFLHDLNTNDEIHVSQVDNPLFLVFVSYKQDENGSRVDGQFQYLQIKWK